MILVLYLLVIRLEVLYDQVLRVPIVFFEYLVIIVFQNLKKIKIIQ